MILSSQWLDKLDKWWNKRWWKQTFKVCVLFIHKQLSLSHTHTKSPRHLFKGHLNMSRHIKTTSQCSSYNLFSGSNCFLIITKQATSPPEVKLPRLISTSATRQNLSSHTLETTGLFSAPLQVSKLVVHFVCTVNIQEIISVFDTNGKWYMESVMSVKLIFDNWCQLNWKKKFNVFCFCFINNCVNTICNLF